MDKSYTKDANIPSWEYLCLLLLLPKSTHSYQSLNNLIGGILMKNVSAKEYLNQFITMQLEIKRKRMRLEILKETATDISVHYDENMVQKSKVNSPFENILVMIMELEKEIQSDIEKLEKQRQEFWIYLSKLSNEKYEAILWYRYAEYKSFEFIARKIGYSIRHTMRLHDKAVAELEELFKN